MATMSVAQVSRANGPFEIVEREVPEPGAAQVRIKVEACGVCHSDALTKTGAYPTQTFPRVPGHEIAGTIDKLGPHVHPWKVGDRVGVGWHGGHCFVCSPCRRGDFLNCDQAQITGLTFDGGYAEYVVVPQAAIARLPAGLAAADAAPLLCAGLTTFNALRNSGARAGDTVAVQGIGGLGHLAIQYASRMGFRTVAIARGADKEALARELGAHEYVDTESTTAAEGLQELGKADLVLATAPHAPSMASTIAGLRGRGKLLIVAAASDPMQLHTMSLLSGKAVQGWPSGRPIDSEDTLNFSALSHVRPRIERFKLKDVEQAYASMMSGKVRFRAVLEP